MQVRQRRDGLLGWLGCGVGLRGELWVFGMGCATVLYTDTHMCVCACVCMCPRHNTRQQNKDTPLHDTRLHLDDVALLQRVVQNAGRVDHLPAVV